MTERLYFQAALNRLRETTTLDTDRESRHCFQGAIEAVIALTAKTHPYAQTHIPYETRANIATEVVFEALTVTVAQQRWPLDQEKRLVRVAVELILKTKPRITQAALRTACQHAINGIQAGYPAAMWRYMGSIRSLEQKIGLNAPITLAYCLPALLLNGSDDQKVLFLKGLTPSTFRCPDCQTLGLLTDTARFAGSRSLVALATIDVLTAFASHLQRLPMANVLTTMAAAIPVNSALQAAVAAKAAKAKLERRPKKKMMRF
jgi:hypothetical protein